MPALKNLRWLCVCSVLALVIAGCGGGDDDDDVATGGSGTDVPGGDMGGSGGDNGSDGEAGGAGDDGDGTSGGSGDANLAATACLNKELTRAGTTSSVKLQVKPDEAADEVIQTVTSNRENNGAAMFQGRQASEILQTTTTQVAGIKNTVDTRQYVQFMAEAARTNAIGSKSSLTADGGVKVTTTTTLKPGNLMRFDLQPGDNYEVSYVREAKSQIEGPTGVRNTTDSTRVERDITYEGRDKVSVPAGDFDTCRFSETLTLTSPDEVTVTESTYWVGVGFGLQVRLIAESDNGENVSVAKALSINGERVSQ